MHVARFLPVCLGAVVGVSAGLAACTQDFDAFEPTSSGSASSTSATGSGGAAGSGGASGSGGMGGSSSTSTSSAGGSGTQSSTSSGSTPMCGDGTQDPGEECDDGNVTPADGCSATCTDEDPDSCPGPAVPLAVGTPVTIQGDTTGAGNDTGMTPCGGSQSGELVYAVTPVQDGMLTATVQANFVALVYARNGCPGGNQNLDCSQGQMPASISFMVQGGQVVHVFVDGYGGNPEEGPFTLTLELQ